MHRVGRTGRAGQSGTAISLLAPSDAAFAAELEAMLQASSSAEEEGADAERQQAAAAAAQAGDSDSSSDDEEGGSGRGRGGAAAGLQPHPRLTKKGVEGLRYRAEDVARSITKNVIKEVRAVQQQFVSRPRAGQCAADAGAGAAVVRTHVWRQCSGSHTLFLPACRSQLHTSGALSRIPAGARQGAEERAAQLAAAGGVLRGAPAG